MKIKVLTGVASITFEVPIYIGATTDDQGSPRFYYSGREFVINPNKNDWGTVVFDHPDETQRGPDTPTFLHFYWDRTGHLQVRPGLRRGILRTHIYNIQDGFSYIDEASNTAYHTGVLYPGWNQVPNKKKVGVLDMLRFLEEKTTLEKLNKKVIE